MQSCYMSRIAFCCHCSKPLTYGIALDQLGSDVVHQYVGQEPSGRNFNELVLDYNSEYKCVLFAVVLTLAIFSTRFLESMMRLT
jgi:glutaminase